MTGPAPQPKFRRDYQPPAYRIDHVDLHVDIGEGVTRIGSRLSIARDRAAAADAPLRLDGRAMQLQAIRIDGEPVPESDYSVDAEGLTLSAPPAAFELAIEVDVDPDANTALEGLYRSGRILCTQCEAEGFSRITYFPDRPDVMATYRTRIEADAGRYPVLLSNGDRVDHGTLPGGRHFAVYEDPFAKPCYLFAMVAGDLAEVADTYRTGSGRDVALRFYTDHGSENELGHALHSLKQAMAWDEKTYGLEYDLDTYMVVAVGSFNMGAMENKGLNIFNTSCVLASPDTATDGDYVRVRDVVAHEYFHNWTGNRVTCRDWFQLSLKESLTVFREQQFAADHGSPGVTRIEQVRMLRDIQFPEDAGPNAHPVRPESYIEMNNFYTITIYEKGAEIIRMLHVILGHEGFTRGVQHYLREHDGGAVTIEDFLAALESANQADLGQFRRWYSQAGTPVVTVHDDYADGRYRLTLSQHTPDTPGQTDKAPLHIPFGLGLLDPEGRAVDLGERALLPLDQSEQSWIFEGLDARPVPSLLRGFSAPVRVEYDHRIEDLAHLLTHDSDPAARWEAGQELALAAMRAGVAAHLAGEALPDPAALIEAVERLLTDPPADHELLAEMLTLPTERRLADQYALFDVDAVVAAHDHVKRQLAAALQTRFEALMTGPPDGSYRFEPVEVGRRRLNAVALDYLAAGDAPDIDVRCLALYHDADNMTDRMAALQALRDRPGPARDEVMAAFAERGRGHALVLDKWFSLQATSRLPGAVARVAELDADPRFDATNPNRVRALVGSFARGNLPGFHQADGAGYDWLAGHIRQLNELNPQIAARLVTPLAEWARVAGPRGTAMREQLAGLAGASLSPDVYEMVTRALDQPS